MDITHHDAGSLLLNSADANLFRIASREAISSGLVATKFMCIKPAPLNLFTSVRHDGMIEVEQFHDIQIFNLRLTSLNNSCHSKFELI